MALLALGLAMVGAVGCGEEEGVAEGASVNVYVEAPACGKGVYGAVANTGDGEGAAVKFVCLRSARGPELGQGVGGGRQIDLAVAGANARRATQDSTTIAYIAPDDPGIGRFTRPILEAAGVGWITAETRREAIDELSRALAESDTNALRADVREALGQG